ncbi:hypothetical protein BJF85_11915, partial [Saccharomonospora sp. CUA-673]|uniref:nucleotidyltransferase family protein n=1 Tax=Saccharomonospora sp. CUA-673 TaxID=1904969 RepID=UPI0009689E93
MTAGLVLAAGEGRRFGMPKALATHRGEPLVARAVRVLTEGGCDPVFVVLGARAEEARPLVPESGIVLVADDWAEGMGASLRTGLTALEAWQSGEGSPGSSVEAVLVQLVDLPDVGAGVVSRIRACAGVDAVVRAAYDGVPGHPVLFGRRWWGEIAEHAVGDQGARGWLRGRTDVRVVECGDIATGRDADTPDAWSNPLGGGAGPVSCRVSILRRRVGVLRRRVGISRRCVGGLGVGSALGVSGASPAGRS